MKLGIIGPPQSGKTTLFNAVSGRQETVGDYSRAVHKAVIRVPDERLDDLATLFNPEKVTHTEIEFLDAAGFTGKGKKSSGAADITPDLRLMDAIIIVVDDFSPNATPEIALQSIKDEMILADLVVLENNIEKMERTIKLTGKKERAGELEILKRCNETLNNEIPLIDMELSSEEMKLIRGYAFLTLKPLLFTFNISEEQLTEHASIYAGYEKYRKEGKQDISAICCRLEMEIAALEEDEKEEFLKELNIARSAVDKFIKRSYALLSLISFFTVSEPECRAWTIKRGTTALKAAGAVHSDFERGFIRAEVASYDDFMEYKTPAALKSAAKLHVEGKEYIVQDGDVILFRFNV